MARPVELRTSATEENIGGMGQARYCHGIFAEDRTGIPKPTSRARNREKPGGSGFDAVPFSSGLGGWGAGCANASALSSIRAFSSCFADDIKAAPFAATGEKTFLSTSVDELCGLNVALDVLHGHNKDIRL
jgi:hypothetical protein